MNTMQFNQEFEVAKENRFLVFEWIRESEFSSAWAKDLSSKWPRMDHMATLSQSSTE